MKTSLSSKDSKDKKREFQEINKVKMTFVYETITAACVFSSMNFLLNAFEVFVKKMCALKKVRVFWRSKSTE